MKCPELHLQGVRNYHTRCPDGILHTSTCTCICICRVCCSVVVGNGIVAVLTVIDGSVTVICESDVSLRAGGHTWERCHVRRCQGYYFVEDTIAHANTVEHAQTHTYAPCTHSHDSILHKGRHEHCTRLNTHAHHSRTRPLAHCTREHTHTAHGNTPLAHCTRSMLVQGRGRCRDVFKTVLCSRTRRVPTQQKNCRTRESSLEWK